ncbi:MAG: type II toxin-antitoxin system RelE/ParE family toxin [Chloroflexi bacterium]|nr:type II toxin-antitoxin system RelE/ParE family toxin [Chloroflexota bacterium]
MYEIVFTSRARREFEKLSMTFQERMAAAIEHLEVNPRPAGVKKLTGLIYRLRVGDWRIIYAVLDKQRRVVIVKVARRSEDTYDKVKDLF